MTVQRRQAVRFGRKARGILSIVAGLACTTAIAHAQAAPPVAQQMVGTWNVRQRMWPGSGLRAIELPAAIAHRRLVGGTFLEEVMETVPGSKQPFTRVAYFNYNAVNRQYEYFSLDTRAPQMMSEKSNGAVASSDTNGRGAILLNGGTFVAPQWGQARDVPFRYRLVLDPIQHDRQLVRLYLTPRSGKNTAEFLAFEYAYTKR